MKALDLAGKTFGRLKVKMGESRWSGGRRRIFWLCRCRCGNMHEVEASALRSGATQSCGCLRDEATSARTIKHGASAGPRGSSRKTREYRAWCHMNERCSEPNNPKWLRYGGRGVSVCEKWRHDFPAFLADMGPCPTGFTLDRINNDGHYEPGNCRWVSLADNMRNRMSRRGIPRTNKLIGPQVS